MAMIVIAQWSFRKIKLLRNLGCLNTRSDPECSSRAFKKTRALQEYQRHKPHTIDDVSILSVLCQIFADCVFVEYLTGALQVQPRF